MDLRTPSIDDAATICALIARRDQVHFGRADVSVDEVLAEWQTPGFELARDAVIAEANGEAIAYAGVGERGSLIVVDPARASEAVVAPLLDWCETHERALGRTEHRQYFAPQDAPQASLIPARGYTLVRSYFRMARALSGAPEPSPLPAEYALRRPDRERDAVVLHTLDTASFAANADFEPGTFEGFRNEHLRPGAFASELSRIVERDDGQPAGFLIGHQLVEEPIGFVAILAIAPEHQGRGLGRALLLGAFADFAGAGFGHAELGVASDNPRALALYESAGMRPRAQHDVFERPVER